MDQTGIDTGAPRRDGGGRGRRRLVGAGLTAAAALTLAACSSSPSSTKASTTTTTTTSSSAARSTTSTARTSTSGGAGGGAAALSALTSKLHGSETGTFKVTYSVKTATGIQTITFAQQPPKSAITTANGSIIDTGTATDFCSTSGGKPTCISSSGSNPIAALTDLFQPKAVLSDLSTVETQIAAHLAGASVSSSSRTIAGQPSTCITASDSSSSGTWCVTDGGILSYVNVSSATLTMTSYSSSVSPSDFQLPAGATVQTLPGGVTIP